MSAIYSRQDVMGMLEGVSIANYAKGVACIQEVEAAALEGHALVLSQEKMDIISQAPKARQDLAYRTAQLVIGMPAFASSEILRSFRDLMNESLRAENVNEAGCKRAIESFMETARKIAVVGFREHTSSREMLDGEYITGQMARLVKAGLFPSQEAADKALAEVMAEEQ